MYKKSREELIAFEERIKALFAEGELPFLIHLSGGNEGQLISIFNEIQEGDWIFSNHRSHLHYLLAGGDESKLEELIKAGRSMFVFDKEINFFTSSILGGTPAIAAGVAWQLKQEGSKSRVWCFIGDGSEDNGHFAEAVLLTQGNQLPCTFIIEDNNRSVDSTIEERSGGFRLSWPSCVRRYHYTPTYPHGGAGLPAGSVKFKQEAIDRYLANS